VKNGFLIFILVLTGLAGKAQFVKRPIIIEQKIHAGMNLPFYKALRYLVQDDIYAFDLSVSLPTYGKNYWEKLYRYPRQGVGFSFWSLGNNDVFGKAYALYSFINIPFFKPTHYFSFNYQISCGGAFLPKKFDIYKNHLNRAIGSQTNIYIRLGIDGKIALFPRSELVIEAGATHFSNGKTRSPNYGINAGSFSLGFNYIFNNKGATIQDMELPATGKRYVQSAIYSAGSKVNDNLLGNKYFVSSVSYNLERIVNLKRRIGAGADFSYDGSIREALASEDGTPEKDFDKLIRFGLHTSYAIQYKQLIMGIQIGYYLYSKCTVITPVYNKISVQYLLTRNMIGSIAIKSHMAKADCLEYGIGYYW
jgi:Lipid A 3-O-deacylase (PagL)